MSQFVFGEILLDEERSKPQEIKELYGYPFCFRFYLKQEDFYEPVFEDKLVVPFVVTDGTDDNTAELLLASDAERKNISAPDSYDALKGISRKQSVHLLSCAIKKAMECFGASESVLVMCDGYAPEHKVQCAMDDLEEIINCAISDSLFFVNLKCLISKA